MDALSTKIEPRAADDGGEGAQDFQDDLEMWGDCSAMVTLLEGEGPVTDLILTPEQVRVMFAALRDHANGNPADGG